MSTDLTLAVPTFNRKNAILENTKKIIDQIAGLPVQYLVIDNSSDDGTYDALVRDFYDNNQVTLKKNNGNVGYFGNFLNIIKNCKTRYILFSSDEDFFVTQNIPYLLDFLVKKRPLMVSGQVTLPKKEDLYRGCKKNTKISAKQLRESSNYISGLVFDCDAIKKCIAFLEDRRDNDMVLIYPQVVLASALFLMGDLYWIDVELTRKNFQLKPNITDKNGGRYNRFESRVRQIQSYDQALLEMHGVFGSKAKLRKIRMQNLNSTFSLVRNSLALDLDDEMLKKFDASAKRYYMKRIIKKPWFFF